MTPRYSRPRLISADDRQYRAFLAGIMVTRANQRAMRPPRARDLFGGEAEAALRDWLNAQLSLSNTRIVEYYEHRGRSAILKYRELDAVAIDDTRSLQIFEIKASQNAASLRRANRQLQETRAILGPLFPRIHLNILLVDTGIPTAEDVAALMASEDAPITAPPTLADIVEALPQLYVAGSLAERSSDPASVSLLRFSVDDIIALVGADGLHLDWSDDDLVDEDEPGLPAEKPGYAYSTADPSDTEEETEVGGALAEALRRAAAGEQPEGSKR